MSAAAGNRSLVLSLYKNILREGSKFSAYNFREYALRRTRDAFRSNKTLSDDATIKAALQEAKQNLESIKRQVIVGNMYRSDKLIIEK